MILALAGDVMLGRGVAAEIDRRSPASFWGDLRPLLLGADLVLANLECAITTHAVPWRRTPKTFHFRAPPAAVEVLKAGGVGVVSLANNHILDFEEVGLADTIRYLDAAGIAHAGAGEDMEAASKPAIVEAAGLKVAVVAFTDNEPGWAAGVERPGANYLAIGRDAHALETVARGLASARDRGADFVILSLHWGPNMVLRPPASFREFAAAALDLGADLIHGHSAHVFQGVEIQRARPILYDTGDVIDDYAVDSVLRNDRSFIFLAEVDIGGVRGLRMAPVRLRYAVVDLAKGRDAEEACARMQELSAEMGTRLERVDSELEWRN